MLDCNGLALRLRGAAPDVTARQARTFNETPVLREVDYVLLQLKAVQNCHPQQGSRIKHQRSVGAHILRVNLGLSYKTRFNKELCTFVHRQYPNLRNLFRPGIPSNTGIHIDKRTCGQSGQVSNFIQISSF
jgi:hypothetical protein